MAAQNRVYTLSLTRVTIANIPITLLQLKAAATVPLQLIRAMIAQTASLVSTQVPVQINRKSGAATVTSTTATKNGPSTDPAASAVGGTSATGVNASAEGTDTDIIVQDVWNFLNGWLWIPASPKEYKFVDAAGIIGLKLPVAAGTPTMTGDLVFEELA